MDGFVRIGTELDTKSFDSQIAYIESQLQELDRERNVLEKGIAGGFGEGFDISTAKEDLIAVNSQYEKMGNQLDTLKLKQIEATKSDFSNVSKSVDTVGNSINSTIKKIGRWALAVFSVRSAYLLIGKAVNSLKNSNEQIKSDLDYINFAIGRALQPIVEWLVQAAYQLLNVLNVLSIKMFGFNLFASASADAFKKTNKSAQDLKKTVAGFDEINIIGDTGTGASFTAPKVDLSKQGDTDKISNFWNDIITFWTKDWEDWFLYVDNNWGAFIAGLGYTLKGFFDIFKGIFDLIVGVVQFFIAIFTGDMDKLKQSWEKLSSGFGAIISGVLNLILGVVLMVLGAIKGILGDILDGIYNGLIKPVLDLFAGLWKGFTDGASAAWDGIKNVFSKVGEFFKSVFTNAWNGIKSVFSSGGKIFDGIKEGISNVFKTILNGLITGINFIIGEPFKVVNNLLNAVRKTSFLGVSPFRDLWKENPLPVPKIQYLKTGGIINNPGHGVPVGLNARGGEAGREGVIPLTDSQAMAELGYMIGKNIVINAVIENKMDSKVVNRVMKTINNSNDFATNG